MEIVKNLIMWQKAAGVWRRSATDYTNTATPSVVPDCFELRFCGKLLRSLYPEVAVFLSLIVGVFVQSVLFFVGIPCSPYPMWISFGCVSAVLFVFDRRRFWWFWLVTGCVLFLTAYTFSYTGTDAMNYHFPQQILLREGWNPIYCSTIEQFDRMVGPYKFGRIHALFLPMVNALCGALVGLSTGLMVADSFLNYVLFLVLIRVAFRFSRYVWGCGLVPAVIFSLAIAVQTKISSFLAGQVDYLPFATLTIVLFCSYLWYRERNNEDLLALCLVASVGMLAKTTGLICCGLVGFLLFVKTWRDRRIWFAISIIAMIVLVVGAHPLLTSLYHYKCPFYPTMSFSKDIPILDITKDFTGNADALSMGWLSRVAYAWISPELVVWAKSALSHSTFSPQFDVVGGVCGYGRFFRILLLLSALAFFVSKKNAVTLMSVFVFILSNLAPTKYIGYSRYFPQIWLIPVLAAYNLMYASAFGKWRVMRFRVVSFLACCMLGAWVAFLGARTIAYQGRMLRFEKLRQTCLRRMSKEGLQVTPESLDHSLSAIFRARCACRDIAQLPISAPLFKDWTSLIISSVAVSEDVADLNDRFPIVDGWRQFLHYDWVSAYADLPDVIWAGKQGGIVK